ncbi:hypothetical protein [Klebsiella aerogenes]|uniref:hypothetical protein n=1 Tax=Klebsiella aerogenes TaxID=548 RepID=UPI000C22462E|nr:hypothetical protein [Klebsiella aerogenes]ATY03436.1 hypothetical protein AM334_22675 [Klebsiella aerogenes]HBV9908959.1 hypothetical protein [Klebsiella aerogenes]
MSKKNSKIPSVIVNEINHLFNDLAAFGVIVQRKQSTKAYIQVLDEYQGNERIHTIYLKDDKIRYRGLNLESGNITEVDIEDNEVKFAMYSTLIMKLPVAFEAMKQLLSLVDKHDLVVVATPKY